MPTGSPVEAELCFRGPEVWPTSISILVRSKKSYKNILPLGFIFFLRAMLVVRWNGNGEGVKMNKEVWLIAKGPAHRPQDEANLSKSAFFLNRPLSINRQFTQDKSEEMEINSISVPITLWKLRNLDSLLLPYVLLPFPFASGSSVQEYQC